MNWKVGGVQSTTDSLGTFAGSGFNIVDEKGKPLVTFGYSTEVEAREAHKLIARALEKAKSVTAHGR